MLQAQIDEFYALMSANFFDLKPTELAVLRQTMLRFYQDARVKVSMLLREKRQKDDGRFVIAVKGALAASHTH